MNVNEMIKRLKQEAQTNDLARAVFVVWGMRDRARSVVSVNNLSNTMVKHGFSFPVERYEDLLKFLADMGIGKIHRSPKGKVQALVDIPIKLQSIGQAASGHNTGLKSMRRKARFKSLPKVEEGLQAAAAPTMPGLVTKPKVIANRVPVVLSVMMGDKRVDIPVPADLSDDEIKILFRGVQSIGGVA